MLRPLTSLLALILCLAAIASSQAQSPVFHSFYGSSQFRSGFQRPVQSVSLRVQSIRPTSATEAFQEPSEDSAVLSARAGGGPTVFGSQAMIRHGVAYAPSNAPAQVKRAIWAINRIVGSRYKWGGGHASFADDGYDCSGTVSYALHHAGLLESPLGSEELTRFGNRGRGRWITVYARRGHVFAVIAGLRLDTTDLQMGGDVGPRWHSDGRDTSNFEPRHFAGA